MPTLYWRVPHFLVRGPSSPRNQHQHQCISNFLAASARPCPRPPGDSTATKSAAFVWLAAANARAATEHAQAPLRHPHQRRRAQRIPVGRRRKGPRCISDFHTARERAELTQESASTSVHPQQVASARPCPRPPDSSSYTTSAAFVGLPLQTPTQRQNTPRRRSAALATAAERDASH